jgi:glycosyltransferase involved in cell wall biosynthesis
MADPASAGGTELQIQIIAERLNQMGIETAVVTFGKIEEGSSNLFVRGLRAKKIPHLHMGNVGLVEYGQKPFLKWLVKALVSRCVQGRIFHIFNPAATHFALIAKELGFRVAYTETGTPSAERWWAPLMRTAAHFEAATAISNASLKQFVKLTGFQKPIYTIYSMIQNASSGIRARMPVEGEFHIIYFGRMTKIKCVPNLISAFSQIVKKFPGSVLSLIGSGEQINELKKLVSYLEISRSVRFIDWLKSSEIFPYLASGDVYCLPSETEGLPCSILEAMSIGLPIVSTEVGGVAELVKEGRSGLLVPPHDVAGLTEKLLLLAQDPSYRIRLGEGGRAAYQKFGTVEEGMNRILKVYGEIGLHDASPL